MLNTLLSKQVDGILYMGNHLTPELRTEIIRSKTPIVLAWEQWMRNMKLRL